MPRKDNPYFPAEFTEDALSKPLDPVLPARAAIIITDSRSGSESVTYKFSSVSEALGNFERVQYERRYANRDQYRAEPGGVHFHNILVMDATGDTPEPVVRSARVVTPNGEWTDTVAHLWVTEGVPHWIVTRGDYTDDSQPVINYQFS